MKGIKAQSAKTATGHSALRDPLWRKVLGYVGAMIVLLLLWELLAWLVGSPAFPLPTAAIPQFFSQLGDLIPQAGISFTRVVVALFIGMALALPLGLWMGRSRNADTWLAPLLYLLYPIPKVVFLPVLLVLLGLGNAPKIVLIALVIFFQTLVTARDAARAIPEAALMSVRSLGATRSDLVREVILPATVPDVFTALRVNTGTAIAILFLAESIAGTSGLGYYIMNAWGMIDYPKMFAGIIAMGLMGVIIYEGLTLVEMRLTRWKRAGTA